MKERRTGEVVEVGEGKGKVIERKTGIRDREGAGKGEQGIKTETS